MVLDPLIALSLVGNIIQFIDFAAKAVSKCRGIHKSVDGVLPDDQELELVASDLARLSKRLEEEHWPKRETADEKSLHDLSNASIKIANELLDRVTKHRVADGAPHRKWKSFRDAFEKVWTKKELEALAARLAQLPEEKFDLATLQQARRFDWLDSHTKYLIRNLSETRATLASKIVAQNSNTINMHLDARDRAEFQHVQTREVILQALQQYASEKKKPARSQTKQKNAFDMMKEEDLLVADGDSGDSTILESLTFLTADNRRFTIAEVHTATFEWVYEAELSDTPWSSFHIWLTQGSGIYWLHGKAGSGKSKLMRFIYENLRTSDLLSQWTTTGKVTTAGFFFWNSGSPDQSSQLGLLRSLLHKILSTKENLVPAIFPTRYEIFRDDLLPTVRQYRWSLVELKHAFQRLLKEDIGHVCLFINDLDEYASDPMEAVTLFKLAISKNIKICLSSRPWVVFEDAFSECPQLKLQYLTAGRMKRLYDSQPLEGAKLVQEIVEKAAGVFLWVRLVVSSLLHGLMNRDKIADLQRRIRLLPSELESLFTI
ncbi:hypothetical protein N431DRAFT_494351 [Stipitochalara longipes BDJ]|nr:hypothetical protein N431DRAFT_494351 [Stipitochalara longipes BDJ]